MFLTQSNYIRGLSKSEYKTLDEMCLIAKRLFNVGLYNVRQHYINEHEYLRYESNYHVAKNNENYKLLQAGCSQQILKVVDRSFKSFFELIKKARNGSYEYNKIAMPDYLKHGERFALIFSTNAISIKDGYFNVPISNAFKAKYGHIKIRIPFPENLNGKVIKEVRIIPCFHTFKIQYCYKQDECDLNLDKNRCLAIDVGLDNLATCVTNFGTSFIMDGRKIKSINQKFNKDKAKLQSILDKQHLNGSKRLGRLFIKRNNKINDQIKKSARYIINYCIENNIGTLVVGVNKEFKQNINIGKSNNQKFVQIPFYKLREQLKTLCELYNMTYIEQEESYTSKASFIDGDALPVFDGTHHDYNFSGRRIKRGLYKSSQGVLLNADVNGALNILIKSKQNILFKRNELCSGLLASPLRIRLT